MSGTPISSALGVGGEIGIAALGKLKTECQSLFPELLSTEPCDEGQASGFD